MNVFPEGLVKLIGTDKGIWSVPVNIHRSNVMWYVPANLKKWGVTHPSPGTILRHRSEAEAEAHRSSGSGSELDRQPSVGIRCTGLSGR